jgi:superfamily II DNA or RNA helicase
MIQGSQSTNPIQIGERVCLRDRIWRVRKIQSLSGTSRLVEVESLEEERQILSVVTPPETIVSLPTEALHFDLRSLAPFYPWVRSHQILATAMVQETGLLTGARFGRLNMEAYQMAPILRLLAKPRPSLLIADDVGLGKTIEAGLALLELLARARAKRVMIVTPPGLLLQWQEELKEKFGLDFTIIENAAGLAKVQTTLPAGVNVWDALTSVLTSIDFLKKETVQRRALRKRWDLVIIDEAHALAESGTPQNPYRTQRTRLGQALWEASRGLVLLTATPHNGYPHSFRSLIELIEPTAATLHGSTELIKRRVEKAMVRRMKAQIRRRRSDGMDEEVFPPRRVTGLKVETSGPALSLLQKVASYCAKTARAARGEEEGELVAFAMQIIKKRALSSRRALGLTLEHRLEALKRQEAREEPLPPAELRDLQADLPISEAAAERMARRLLRSAIPKEEKRRQNEVRALNSIRRLLQSLSDPDPKIAALILELQAIFARDPSEKVIVFTEYRDTLEEVRLALDSLPDLAGTQVILRGGMSSRQRARVQDAFEQERTRILLATDAASEGLNLQRACRRIIHFELPWNPNRLEQRNGRVDRYGQTRPPEIRYLYYSDSPEEEVLDRLVQKIEKMREDRVSTPDILGVLSGGASLDIGLVELDPDEPNLANCKDSLIKHFEDRTAEFVRQVQPLLAAGEDWTAERQQLLGLLDTATPLLPEDLALEEVVLGILGSQAVQPTKEDGIFRMQVPLAYRGPEVKHFYHAVTFRRSVAIRYRASEVEYLTPLHPLIQAMAAEARRRLLLVYPDAPGLPPRRLSARRLSWGEPASVLFTFLGTISGGGGLIEESLLTVRLDTQGKAIGTSKDNQALLFQNKSPGEVPQSVLTQLFSGVFENLTTRAQEIAEEALLQRLESLRQHRQAQAAVLHQDLERDLADRLAEIDTEERRARGLMDESTRQLSLFGELASSPTSYQARRAAAQAQADSRRQELLEFARLEEPLPPRPLGALFLVPEDEAPADIADTGSPGTT